jgi:hypothetical protein
MLGDTVDFTVHTPGSGQGIGHAYAHYEKSVGIVRHAESAVFTMEEIDSVEQSPRGDHRPDRPYGNRCARPPPLSGVLLGRTPAPRRAAHLPRFSPSPGLVAG